MNRSLANVILGGYSITAKEVAEKGEAQSHQETDISGAVDAITNARSVIIVPGYGLAVASAQYAIADLVKTLTSKDIKVRSACSHTHSDSFADAAVRSLVV
jgi:NAD/NADP transhydrogenase beta subunit